MIGTALVIINVCLCGFSAVKNWDAEVSAMIGYTNIFLSKEDGEDAFSIGEAEIMIAEKAARGKKCGWEAIVLMLLYGAEHLNLTRFEAKIKVGNEASMKMFDKLRFEEKSRSDIFGEVTLARAVDPEWIGFMKSQAGNFELRPYERKER